MYIRMLNEAVANERGEAPPQEDPDEPECLVDLRLDAHIPETYVESVPQRLSVYRRIASVRSTADAEDVLDELIDRYGDPPESVRGLLTVSLVRNAAIAHGIYEISQRKDDLVLFANEITAPLVMHLSTALQNKVTVGMTGKPSIRIRMRPGDEHVRLLERITAALDAIPKAAAPAEGGAT